MKASPFLWPDNFTGLSVDALAEHLSLSAFFLCFRIHEATTSFLATASTALLPQKLLCKPITTKKPPALDWRQVFSRRRREDGEDGISTDRGCTSF